MSCMSILLEFVCMRIIQYTEQTTRYISAFSFTLLHAKDIKHEYKYSSKFIYIFKPICYFCYFTLLLNLIYIQHDISFKWPQLGREAEFFCVTPFSFRFASFFSLSHSASFYRTCCCCCCCHAYCCTGSSLYLLASCVYVSPYIVIASVRGATQIWIYVFHMRLLWKWKSCCLLSSSSCAGSLPFPFFSISVSFSVALARPTAFNSFNLNFQRMNSNRNRIPWRCHKT